MSVALRLQEHPSPNRVPRPPGTAVDTLVLHYTGMANAEVAVARLCDPQAQVSAHYVVLEDGTVLRLVDEAETAWHAGVSAWRGQAGLNHRSIGIEIVNGGHAFGLPAFAEAQIEAVIALSRGIVQRWSLPPAGVVGHGDVAPMRRADPGERFPWERLAAAGVGVWPAIADAPPSRAPLRDLGRIGYALDDAPQPTSVTAVVLAFQRRFLPTHLTARLDRATAMRIGQLIGTGAF
ncbi:MAG: N-acetylmuramoyl-L-alanine amidase [Geminicoccaceae bacterium]|nr:MAG: N-acetylmuramoyl-L-alanine amidase [Geminicoccaceae bacterium]